MDPTQIEASINLQKALRRAILLAVAAEVSQNITHILDIDELLPKTVDIICDAYGFYYAGVFLIDPAGVFAVLRAGRGEPGRIMIENHRNLIYLFGVLFFQTSKIPEDLSILVYFVSVRIRVIM